MKYNVSLDHGNKIYYISVTASTPELAAKIAAQNLSLYNQELSYYLIKGFVAIDVKNEFGKLICGVTL